MKKLSTTGHHTISTTNPISSQSSAFSTALPLGKRDIASSYELFCENFDETNRNAEMGCPEDNLIRLSTNSNSQVHFNDNISHKRAFYSQSNHPIAVIRRDSRYEETLSMKSCELSETRLNDGLQDLLTLFAKPSGEDDDEDDIISLKSPVLQCRSPDDRYQSIDNEHNLWEKDVVSSTAHHIVTSIIDQVCYRLVYGCRVTLDASPDTVVRSLSVESFHTAGGVGYVQNTVRAPSCVGHRYATSTSTSLMPQRQFVTVLTPIASSSSTTTLNRSSTASALSPLQPSSASLHRSSPLLTNISTNSPPAPAPRRPSVGSPVANLQSPRQLAPLDRTLLSPRARSTSSSSSLSSLSPLTSPTMSSRSSRVSSGSHHIRPPDATNMVIQDSSALSTQLLSVRFKLARKRGNLSFYSEIAEKKTEKSPPMNTIRCNPMIAAAAATSVERPETTSAPSSRRVTTSKFKALRAVSAAVHQAVGADGDDDGMTAQGGHDDGWSVKTAFSTGK